MSMTLGCISLSTEKAIREIASTHSKPHLLARARACERPCQPFWAGECVDLRDSTALPSRMPASHSVPRLPSAGYARETEKKTVRTEF